MHQNAQFDAKFEKKNPGEALDPHQWEGDTPSHTQPRRGPNVNLLPTPLNKNAIPDHSRPFQCSL
ncbi:hypothetical protein DPMN_018865 [Dreissena polymorpha]|uniref:Uncharacterized protein n=1 Tax=Dreissena polymorpha TaxID=45954 RepID=A0A9D4NDZ8_DREPO|nr:hypothetical protein DPMN_120664 [Dreissena polymorpha]KAH3894708.1 hypothetical protein DPMN_018865 [Dreissena polymorpha]